MLYIFLELVSQGTLEQAYKNCPFKESQVSHYTRQILQGLSMKDHSQSLKLGLGSSYWMAPEVANPKRGGFDESVLCCSHFIKQSITAHTRSKSGMRIDLSVSVSLIFAASMDVDERVDMAESSIGNELVEHGGELAEHEGDDMVVEPHEGMVFDSEDAAKIFYDEYARQIGFVMRVMSCRRSERDGRILARRLGCNKEGYCVSIRGKFGNVRKPRPSTREGCKAMIHVKFDKSGKWVITKFVKDHNHPLVVAPREARQTLDEKDKKIQELTAELRNKKRLCATYQEQLAAFVKIVEDHSEKLSKKVKNVVENLKEFESIEQELMPA
ncbi:hypothetical protein DKX38_026511 [Salix brachista]|uniref:FAR1 domain-containing protein n=2 Tax=Salix TaxID=40685 RepID=A0A5N5JEZ7_9ROSI|nr:hypothetical protein DKX38_026511 [Salix brachista]